MFTSSIFDTPGSLGNALVDFVLSNLVFFLFLLVVILILTIIKLFNSSVNQFKEYRWKIGELESKLQDITRDSRVRDKRFSDMSENSFQAASKNNSGAKEKEEALQRLERIADMEIEAKKALSSIRDSTGSFGVVNFDDAFREDAKKHLLISMILAAMLIILSAFFIYYFHDAFTDLTESIDKEARSIAMSTSSTTTVATYSNAPFQMFWARMILVAFFSIVFFQIMKLINANMHLFVLNNHRVNSLKTFEKFQSATDNQMMRDAILMKVVSTVFDAGETGYVSGKGQGSENSTSDSVRIIEPTVDYEKIYRYIQDTSLKK